MKAISFIEQLKISAPEGFCITDYHGNILDVNQRLCEILITPLSKLTSGINISTLDSEGQSGSNILFKTKNAGHHKYFSKLYTNAELVIEVEISLNYLDLDEGYYYAFISETSKGETTNN